jgi:hypothetical protein
MSHKEKLSNCIYSSKPLIAMTILNTTKLTEIFIFCDDFEQVFQPYCQEKLIGQSFEGQLSKSEMMSIYIFYHHSGIRCFKWYYDFVILRHLESYFPLAYSYSRFIQCLPSIQLDLFAFLCLFCLKAPSQANFIDSKKLSVCHNKRIHQHKTFQNIASRGKTSVGWFFGFKLHLIINQYAQIVRFKITSGHIADNNQRLLEELFDDLKGLFYGDKGYLTKLKEQFSEHGLMLITKTRSNMKKEKLSAEQRHYLKKRGLIETVFDLLTSICDLEHTRHRSPVNFISNCYAALIAYSFLDHKPTISPYKEKLKLEDMKIVLI